MGESGEGVREGIAMAIVSVRERDPLDLLLEAAFMSQQGFRIHGHVCSVCRRLRTCCQGECEWRGEREREWVCCECQTKGDER